MGLGHDAQSLLTIPTVLSPMQQDWCVSVSHERGQKGLAWGVEDVWKSLVFGMLFPRGWLSLCHKVT